MKKKIAIIDNSLSGYEIRKEEHEGKEHIVVPVVMMVEGVHAGSQGPMLYLEEELGAFVDAWNGIPVVINHPQDKDGTYISANSPQVIDREIVGRVYNTVFENGKLKAEAWINPERLENISPEALESITDNLALDVSVGVFSDDENTSGDWQGEQYNTIARHLRPDHLALLPGAVGACSWDDGCGIRANEENKSQTKKKGGKMAKDAPDLKNNDKANSALKFVSSIVLNQEDYLQVLQKARSMVDAMDSEMAFHFLEALYGDYLIYRKSYRGSYAENRGRDTERYYRQNYSINEDGDFSFEGDPVEVNKNIEYAPVANSGGLIRTKFNNNSKKEGKMSKCEKVGALISNKATKWTEDDREFLNSLEESQLDKFTPVEEKKKEDPEPKVNSKKEEKSEESGKIVFNSQEDFNKAVLDVFKEQKDPDEFIKNFAPGEVKDQMEAGLKMYRDQRNKLIKSITDNSDFSEEELKDWTPEKLEKLAKTVQPEEINNYSALGNYSVNSEGIVDNEEMEAMLGPELNSGKKEEKED